MYCGICFSCFNLEDSRPLVLVCGHTFCKGCVQRGVQLKGYPITCPVDRQADERLISDLPTNFALVDAARLELAAAYKGLLPSASSSGGIGSSHAVSKLWLDEKELELSGTIIGSGSTGQVVAGRFEGRQVAVKVVDLSAASAASRQALQQEARLAMMLLGECRHICQYKGATIQNNKFCLVMKRYSKSLDQVLAGLGAPPHGLPLPRLHRYASQALAALHELHTQGVIMAHLKPQNLLLDEDLDELVLTDLGLSSIMSRSLTRGGLTGVGQDTLCYMAPEQHLVGTSAQPLPGTEALTPAADLWAWACIVIYMATGAAPLANLSTGQIIRHVGVQKLAPEIPGSLPEPLGQLLSKCLSAEPEQRPTATQALKVLQGAEGLYQFASSSPVATATGTSETATAPAMQPTHTQPDTARLLQLVHEICHEDPEVQAAALHELAYMALAGAAAAAGAEIAAVPGCLSELVALLGSSSAEVQEQAARVLAILSCNTTAGTAIAALPGCLDRLVALLANSAEGMHAAHVLANLAGGTEESQAAIAAVPGSLQALVSLLDSTSSAGVREQAAHALARLAKGSAAISAAIGAVPSCLDNLMLMLDSSCPCQEQAAGALANLAGSLDSNSAAIAAIPGSWDKLAALLGSSSVGVQLQAALAIANLPISAATREPRTASGSCLSRLRSMLDSDSTGVQEQAARTLLCLSCISATHSAAITEVPGCLEKLVALLCSSSSGVQLEAARAVGSLIRDSDAACARIVDLPGGLTCIAALLGSSNTAARLIAAYVLMRMTDANGDAAKSAARDAIITEPNCLQRLVALLLDSSRDVQHVATLALLGLSYGVGASKAIMVAVPGCVSGLTTMLSSPDQEVRFGAIRVLGNLAFEEPTNQAAIAAEPGCLNQIVALLDSGCEKLQEQAARTLGNIAYNYAAKADVNSEVIAAVPGCLDQLVALLVDGNGTGVMVEVVALLHHLALDNAANKASIAAVPGCLARLVTLLDSTDEELQLWAARALGSLACDNAANQSAIAAESGWLTLVSLLESWDEDMQAAAAAALGNLACNHAANKDSIASMHGCLDRLAELRNSSNDEVQEHAACAHQILTT